MRWAAILMLLGSAGCGPIVVQLGAETTGSSYTVSTTGGTGTTGGNTLGTTITTSTTSSTSTTGGINTDTTGSTGTSN